MRSTDLDAPGVRRAWGWAAALRDGTTTRWSDWRGEAEPLGVELPGAQQLELLRRLNEAGRALPAGLADRVLTAAVPGRGRADLLLAGVGKRPRFGPPPVDPAELTAEELTRLATGLIAEDLAAVDESVLRQPRVRRRPWVPSYQLAGDPWLARPMREELRRLGRPEQEHPDCVYVVGADLATMLSHAWTTRAFAESGSGWTSWLAGFVDSDRLPRRARLVATARHCAERFGADRVTVVLDPSQLTSALRLRRPLADPPEPSATAVDLVRRISVTLGILRPAERRTALLRGVLLPRLPQHRPASPAHPAALAVPARWHDWVHGQAARMRDRLIADGYPVLGSPDSLLPSVAAGGSDPAVADVLELALQLLRDPVTSSAEEGR